MANPYIVTDTNYENDLASAVKRLQRFGKEAFNYQNPFWGSRFNTPKMGASYRDFIEQWDGPPTSRKDPYSFSGDPYSPEAAQAAIANALANPIAPIDWTLFGPHYANGYHIGDVRIKDQEEEEPENPGIRKVTSSTYGVTIPVSLGRRRMGGNVIQSGSMVPKLVGTFEYEIEYQIPIYEDPPAIEGGFPTVGPSTSTWPSGRPRPDPEDPSTDAGTCGQAADSPCNPRATKFPTNPAPPDPGGGGDGLYYATPGLSSGPPTDTSDADGPGQANYANFCSYCSEDLSAGWSIWQNTSSGWVYVTDMTCNDTVCAFI